MNGNFPRYEQSEQGPKSSTKLETGLALTPIIGIPAAIVAPEGIIRNTAIFVSAAAYVGLLIDQYIKGDFRSNESS
jgi:hypothetical protein